MQIQNNNHGNAAALAVNDSRRIDPLSAGVLGRFARQKAIARFIGKAAPVFVQGVRWLAKPFLNWNHRNVLYNELQALPDYLLKDIGFTRDEIAAVVNHEFRRQPLSLSPTRGQPASSVSGTENRKEEKPLAA
jgi:uncharacterized protein YjiS (DUF1127 family)|tara:strand:+ start:982 stop:1380 length:399 start_codon:yes stop_codon:yes gene_type:complete